ncbi:minor histocompatibility protein HA-1-like [Sinocyclocheilus rhinocerous]|uniref:minor histocompatibility protein HA-1-like n=1 Tax=Sinocyclocheilus rhinocerous TaxID=307959 RepID=UPI0007BA5CA1|nr:PREDICTED: minor histocompatibility protein HA-1-like [Sinocyclocheilus rhinocerous]
MSAEEVDIILQRSEGGVDSALTYAKTITKYIKDMIGYIERKLALELEFSKGLQRIYQTCKQTITQPHMPFFSIYSLALEQDLEQSSGMHQAASTLQNQTFIMVQHQHVHLLPFYYYGNPMNHKKEYDENWHTCSDGHE